MKLNYNFLLICFVLVSFDLFSQSCDYYDSYKLETDNAISLFFRHKEAINKNTDRIYLSDKFIWSIIAPELVQYNYLSDKIQTYSLKVLYVQNGSSYSNFSVGPFQMKPSFVEDLEKYISTTPIFLEKYKRLLIKEKDLDKARIVRLDRLIDIDFQIDYLLLFCDIVSYKFPEVNEMCVSEKLKFYSTTYNYGFLHSKEDILKIENNKSFPYFSFKKYCYGDLSYCFYKNLLDKK